MAEAPKKSSRFLELALIVLITYLVSQTVLTYFFPQKKAGDIAAQPVTMQAAAVRFGNTPIATVQNNTDKALQLATRCPMPPFDVFAVTSSGSKESLKPLITKETAVPCQPIPAVAAKSSAQVSLAPWKFSLFGNIGTYELRLPKEGTGASLIGTGSVVARFDVYEPGTAAQLFRAFISKPFFNFLLFVGSLLPDHNLGISIIVLTIVVKLLLFYPTQKSMEGQKKMQMLQPKLDAVKKQYADNQQKMQEETMKLWKEHGVNPVQSCLPIVLQLPILIGLFYVIRDGVDPALSPHLVYPFYQHLGWSFNNSFLGLDLTKMSLIFAPILVVLQFLQMKLSFMIAKKKSGEKAPTPTDKAQHIQQQVMLYVMPLFIGFFSIKVAAAVSLYWGVSTLFAIGQQLIVNREHLKV